MSSFHRQAKLFLAIGMTLTLAVSPVFASTLRDFEDSATRPDRGDRRTETSGSSVVDDVFGEIFADCLTLVIFTLVIEPVATLAAGSMSRVDPDRVPDDLIGILGAGWLDFYRTTGRPRAERPLRALTIDLSHFLSAGDIECLTSHVR